MAAGDVVLQADGAYADVGDGRLLKLNAIATQTPNGGLVCRFPPRTTTIVAPRDNRLAFNMRDLIMTALAITHGGLTYAELQLVAPGVATILQNQGVLEGTSDASTNSIVTGGG